MAATVPYPASRETDVVLRDGSTLHVRPIRPDDEAGLLAFYAALSEDARVMRFFSPLSDAALIQQVRRDVAVDHVRRVGLVATRGPRQQVVAEASYSTVDGDHAEVAFAVADAYQGRGVATILLGQLAEIAASHEIHTFQAFVLPDNQPMIDVFRQAGFPVDVHYSGWELLVTFPTSLTEEALARFEQRDQVAAQNALRAFFAPRAVAVIGASRRRGTIGGEVFHNLLRDGFEGPVYPVNPAAPVVQSVPAYPTVGEIPGPVDLAVVTVPAEHVCEVAAQCADAGVRALVVISAGFGESGPEGKTRQAELLKICRTSGMRLIGPNCMGLLNTDAAVRLNATFAPRMPPPGRVAFSTQSGALGLAIIDYAASLGLGLSTFVSIGNKADISGNDLLNYWDTDPATDVILLYLESFGNPRRFGRIARRVARTKPIVAVKSGRSPAGSRATSSHTGALVASDVTVDALFRQAGVIRTDTLEELFDVASLLANQPVPAGNRVAILTNGGGAGVLCADACEAEDLAVPSFGEETRSQLRALLPPEASTQNPVDMLASATAGQYRDAVRILAADPQVDALIVIFVPPLVTEPGDVAQALVEAAREVNRRKPIATVFMSARGVPEALRAPDVRLPSYTFPEAAAIALARAVRYGEWRARPAGTVPRLPDARCADGAALVSSALTRGGGWLTPEETHTLFSSYGLPLVPQRIVATPAETAAAADDLARETGTPETALKAIGPDLLHKTEVGAVKLGLRGAGAVRAAAEDMQKTLAAGGHVATGWLLQPMAAPGVEMIVGVVHDPHFGPVVACGAGGTLVEVLRDVAVRLAPLTDGDAREMIESLKIAPALAGVRGRPPADVPALVDVLVRIGMMVEDLPQIAELDCNPVIVHEHGATIVDVRVRVAALDLPPLLGRPRPDAGPLPTRAPVAGSMNVASPPSRAIVADAAAPSTTHDAQAKTRLVAFIANSLSDTVTLVDGRTLEPFATLPVGREPHKFRRSLSGGSVYSCNATGNEMIEIDLGTLRPVRHIPILDPYNITFTADGRYLYKLALRYTFVEVHDAQTFRRAKRIETGRQPSHFALSDDQGWFVNVNQHSDVVTVIDTHSMTVIHRLPVDPLPAGVALSRDARHLFVASGDADSINVFATDEWKLVTRVHSGKDAHEMVMTRDGRTLYVTNRGEDTVSAFDVPRRRVAAKFHVPGGPDMPMLSPDESQLWVSGRYGDMATVIDTRTLRILTTFPAGHSPHGVFLTRTQA